MQVVTVLTYCNTKQPSQAIGLMPFMNSKAARGANITFIVVMFVVVLAFLGIASFTGMATFLQDELQKSVTTAALTGASAFFDGDTAFAPAPSPPNAMAAATASFQRSLQYSQALQSFNATLNGVGLNNGNQTVTVTAAMDVNVPFLALVGVNNFRMNAVSTARYLRQNVRGFPATLYNPAPAGAAPAADITETGACGTLPAVRPAVDSNLALPVTDRKGPDIFIDAPGGQGYMVYACTNTQCWDVSYAARVGPNGFVRDANLDGTDHRIIYGSSFIDLGATGPNYNANVKKATRLRIVDDGIPDRYAGGVRQIEVCPQGLVVNAVQTMHHASNCTDAGACVIPPGFVAN